MKIKRSCIKSVKVFLLFLSCIIVLFQTACAGLSDWTYDMKNGYEIWRVNSRSIVCGKAETSYSITPVAGDYVSKFYYNSRYIYLQCVDVPENLYEDINTDNPVYYIINVLTDEVFGPMTKAEFEELIISTQIDVESISWINTVPMPDDGIETHIYF